MITASLPTREDGYLIRGLGRTIVAIADGGWPEPPTLYIGGDAYAAPTMSTTTAADDTATWRLAIAQVAAIDEAAGAASVVGYWINVGAGEAEDPEIAGYLLIADQGTPGTGSQVGPLRLVVGPPGPTSVSADVGNVAEIGTDGLIFVSPTAGSAHVIKDEGVALTNRAALNFAGAGVTVTDDAGNGATLVTIPSGGATTLDALTDVATAGQSAGKALVTDGTNWAPSAAAVVLTNDARMTDARTPTAHAHTIADTTGLQAALDGKQAAGSYAAALGADDNYVTDAEKVKLANLSGTNTGDQTLPTWSTIAGKPAVVAAGATQADARTAIGAGTSNLVVGTGAGDAKAGNYAPDLSGYSTTSHTHDGTAAVNTVAATGSTETLSAAYELHDVTMDQNCTFTFTSPTAGAVFAVILRGAFTPTWPATVKWPDGTAPTYATPAVYVFSTFTAGAAWAGVQSGKAFA